MKRSELKQIVLEAMKGYSKYAQGGETKGGTTDDFRNILTAIAKGRPEEGDPVRGNKILDKADPDNVARITRGEKPVYKEGAEQDYTVIFYVNDMDYDWDVKATSPEDAIAKVKSGEVKGPYDQTLPRTARAFSAKLRN
jgi:hypothetical protein